MKEIDDFIRAQCAPLLKARGRLAMPAGLDSGLVQLLRCVSSACIPGFEAHSGRALAAQEESAALAASMNQDRSGDAELVYRIRAGAMLKSWEIERLIFCFTPDSRRKITANDWWRSYPVDYLVENFRPWCVYVSLDGFTDSKGDSGRFGGFFATFDCFEGELCLSVQQISKAGEWFAEMLHVYPMKSGQTLGQVADGYGFRMRDAAQLKKLFTDSVGASEENVAQLLTQAGETMAAYVFPMLVAMMSDEMVKRRECRVEVARDGKDVPAVTPVPGFADMPVRNPGIDGIDPALLERDSGKLRVLLMRLRDEEPEGGLN